MMPGGESRQRGDGDIVAFVTPDAASIMGALWRVAEVTFPRMTQKRMQDDTRKKLQLLEAALGKGEVAAGMCELLAALCQALQAADRSAAELAQRNLAQAAYDAGDVPAWIPATQRMVQHVAPRDQPDAQRGTAAAATPTATSPAAPAAADAADAGHVQSAAPRSTSPTPSRSATLTAYALPPDAPGRSVAPSAAPGRTTLPAHEALPSEPAQPPTPAFAPSLVQQPVPAPIAASSAFSTAAHAQPPAQASEPAGAGPAGRSQDPCAAADGGGAGALPHFDGLVWLGVGAGAGLHAMLSSSAQARVLFFSLIPSVPPILREAAEVLRGRVVFGVVPSTEHALMQRSRPSLLATRGPCPPLASTAGASADGCGSTERVYAAGTGCTQTCCLGWSCSPPGLRTGLPSSLSPAPTSRGRLT